MKEESNTMEERFDDKFSSMTYHNVNIGECADIKQFIQNEIRLTEQSLVQRVKGEVGFLRQWLNEDRITQINKMVTNEQIEVFLPSLSTPKPKGDE